MEPWNQGPEHLAPPWPSSHCTLCLSNWLSYVCLLTWPYLQLPLFYCYIIPCPAPLSNPMMSLSSLPHILHIFHSDFASAMATRVSILFFTLPEHSQNKMSSIETPSSWKILHIPHLKLPQFVQLSLSTLFLPLSPPQQQCRKC